MDGITIGFLCWVLWATWRGSRKGMARALASVLSVFAAYGLSIILVPLGIELLGEKNWLWVSMASFGLSTFTCYWVILFLFKLLRLPLGADRVGGAVVGAVHGCVMGAVLVWAAGLLLEPIEKKTGMQLAGTYYQSPVVQYAGKTVGWLVSTGMQWYGVDSHDAAIAGVFAQQPGYVVSGVKAVSQSPETKQFVSNATMQKMMAQNDIDGLVRSPEYVRFATQPAVQEFVKIIDPVSTESPDRAVAATVSKAWRANAALKDDPEYKAIMQDPEVQQAIKENNSAALMSSPRAKELLALVFKKMSDDTGEPTSKALMPDELLEGFAKEVETTADTSTVSKDLYRWRDADGTIHYSDLQAIPPEFKASAELFR